THRAYVLAASCDQPTRILQPLRAHDCDSTLAALSQLGATVQSFDDGVGVSGPLSLAHATTLDLGNSGTSLRLLLGQASLLKQRVKFTGDTSLQSRPNVELLEALSALGAKVEATNGCAPIELLGPIRGGMVALPSAISSQFASGLLLGLAKLNSKSTLVLEAPIHSRPYFEITVDMAREFGCEVDLHSTDVGLTAHIQGGTLRSPGVYAVEGDWSSAAFLLVAAWARERPIALNGLKANSLQADQRIVGILRQLGCSFVWGETDRLHFTPRRQSTIDYVNVRDCPDLFPILCVLAALLPTRTTISGAPNLRHKESDRIQLMFDGLQTLGLNCNQLPDGIVIEGGEVKSGRVETQLDHRIRMSFRVLAAVTNTSIQLDGEGCEKVSYPNFEHDLERLLTGTQGE
ncbi:MAG: 3-phosphoshikimate 1-carboxyvinyltransferase, partial [Bradymonadia bacterium]